MRGRPKVNGEVKVDKTCVFAVCNQTGKMAQKVGNQKYCMIMQNRYFEGTCGVPEKCESDMHIDQELWTRYGYEDVCKVEKHACDTCVFYKNQDEYKLVPSSLKVRYAWTVERRDAE